MEADPELLPGIVVLNHKYFPQDPSSAFSVGATSFAFSVADCLDRCGRLQGLILYRRDEALKAPEIETGIAHGRRTVTLNFNFSMTPDALRDGLTAAISHLATFCTPIVYYQTDTLLAYHPRQIPCCVTHHGPFVDHFASMYSAEEAQVAYGNAEKVVHLAREQRKGIRALASMNKAFVLQHSALQMRHLVWSGVREEIIQPIAPPILCSEIGAGPLDASLDQFLGTDRDGPVLLSNVARIDYFKNLDLLVSAGVRLISQGMNIRVLITGGAPEDDAHREALLAAVPPEFRPRFHIAAKLDQPSLMALFKRLEGTGIFACTSRYETLGITPLEAALSGVCTISPDLPWVECSRYLPPTYRYRYTVEGLAGLIASLLHSGRHRDACQRDNLRERISRQLFEHTLITCWREMSRRARSGTDSWAGGTASQPSEQAA